MSRQLFSNGERKISLLTKNEEILRNWAFEFPFLLFLKMPHLKTKKALFQWKIHPIFTSHFPHHLIFLCLTGPKLTARRYRGLFLGGWFSLSVLRWQHLIPPKSVSNHGNGSIFLSNFTKKAKFIENVMSFKPFSKIILYEMKCIMFGRLQCLPNNSNSTPDEDQNQRSSFATQI